MRRVEKALLGRAIKPASEGRAEMGMKSIPGSCLALRILLTLETSLFQEALPAHSFLTCIAAPPGGP